MCLVRFDFDVIVANEFVVIVKAHQLQLELAIVSVALPLLNAKLNSARISSPRLAVNILAVPGCHARSDRDHLRGIDHVADEFSHLYVSKTSLSVKHQFGNGSVFIGVSQAVCSINPN